MAELMLAFVLLGIIIVLLVTTSFCYVAHDPLAPQSDNLEPVSIEEEEVHLV